MRKCLVINTNRFYLLEPLSDVMALRPYRVRLTARIKSVGPTSGWTPHATPRVGPARRPPRAVSVDVGGDFIRQNRVQNL